MRPVKGSGHLPFSSRRALVTLRDEFKQRKIGKTGGSFRRMLPLDAPSGPQWVESELEANAVIQIAFVPTFYDLITQPIIKYEICDRKHVYTPDIACIFGQNRDPFPGRFLIEVKRRDELKRKLPEFADRFHAAREFCADMGAAFRVLHEDHLQTAYLKNALLLRRDMNEDPDLHASDLLKSEFGERSFTKRDAEEALGPMIRQAWERTQTVRRLIAWRELACDLMLDLTDDSELRIPSDDVSNAPRDPFLKMLQDMDSEVNI